MSTARKETKAHDKLIFVEFRTEWSMQKVKLAAEVWSDDRIIKKLNNYIPVYQDLEVDEESTHQYQISVVPSLLILESNDQEVLRINGTISKSQMNEMLNIPKESFQAIIELNNTFRDSLTSTGSYLFGEEFQELAIQLPKSVEPFFLKPIKAYLKKITADPSESARESNEKARIRKMINRCCLSTSPEQNARRLEKRLHSSKLSVENKTLALYAAILYSYQQRMSASAVEQITNLEKISKGAIHSPFEQIGIISKEVFPE